MMPVCHCCKAERDKKGLAPRELIEMGGDFLLQKNRGRFVFKNRKASLFLCKVCDGDALSDAERIVRGTN